MINLSSTTDKLQIILGAAVTTNAVDCYVAYRDTTATSISPIGVYTSVSSASATDIVSSPSASTQRLVEYISIQNRDTQPADVYVRFSDNGTIYILHKAILSPNDKLEYSDKKGFRVISSVGTIKTNYTGLSIPTNSSQSVSVLDRDITFSITQSGNFIDPSLAVFGFPVEANGLYSFDLLAFYDASATTNGARFNLMSEAGDLTGFYYWKSLTTTGFTVGYAITNPLVTPSAEDASSPATTANNVLLRGFFRAGKSEFVKLWFAQEETSPSTMTLKAGSRVHFYKVA